MAAGAGDRAHLASPDVGVGTHVDDVLATLRMEDVHDAVLMLHSYSGVLAGPVADAAGDRIARVVAAGAFLADPGESLADVEPPEAVGRSPRCRATTWSTWHRRSGASTPRWSGPACVDGACTASTAATT